MLGKLLLRQGFSFQKYRSYKVSSAETWVNVIHIFLLQCIDLIWFRVRYNWVQIIVLVLSWAIWVKFTSLSLHFLFPQLCNGSISTHLVVLWQSVSAAQRAQHTLVSSLFSISISPENKYDQESQAELAKHLHSQIIFIIIITVINQTVICTLEWEAQRSVHRNNMTQFSFQKELCCFTRWKYHGSFAALGWRVTFSFFQNVFSWPSGYILSGRAAADSWVRKREKLCRHLAV